MGKCHMYQDIICGVDFVPVAMCMAMSSAWGQQAIGLIKEIGCRIAAISMTIGRHHSVDSAYQSPFSEETRPAFSGHCPKRALSTSRPIPVTVNRDIEPFI